jgi:hypothetical protein
MIEARNLTAADRGGTSDPYVKIRVTTPVGYYSSPSQFKTNVIKKTLNPQWNERWTFVSTAPPQYCCLGMRVYDRDVRKDDHIGSIRLSLDTIAAGGWVHLQGKHAGNGEIHLKCAPPGDKKEPTHATELPPGWGQAYDATGRLFFINNNAKSTTYRDPRTGRKTPKPVDNPPAWTPPPQTPVAQPPAWTPPPGAQAAYTADKGAEETLTLETKLPADVLASAVPPPRDESDSEDSSYSDDSDVHPFNP